MPAGVVVVDRGGWERGARLSAFTQGTFSRGRCNIIHAEIIFHRPYAISAGSFIFKLRQSSCFSDLWIFARRMVPDWAVEIGNLTNLRAVSDHFRNISAGMCNIIHAVLPFRQPYAISVGCFSSVTPCRVLSTSTEYNIIHAALPFRRP